MRSSFEAFVECQSAMFEQTRFGTGNRRLEKSVALVFLKHRPFQEWDHLIEDGHVGGDLDIVGDRIGKPAEIIRDACADTAPGFR